MSTLFKVFVLGIGGGAIALIAKQRKRAMFGVEREPLPIVPRTPIPYGTLDLPYDAQPNDENFDETIAQDLDPEVGGFRIGEFDVDAREAFERDSFAQELAEEQDLPLDEIRVGVGDPPLMSTIVEMPEGLEGSGELYGVVVPQAVDHELAAEEDHDAYQHADDGENWVEALSASATEYGASPEHDVDVEDESDEIRQLRAIENAGVEPVSARERAASAEPAPEEPDEYDESQEDEDRRRAATQADEPIADKGSAGTSGL